MFHRYVLTDIVKGYFSTDIGCTSYTFYPCNLMQINGAQCVDWTGDEHEYRKKLEKRYNTIILVSLDDCNLNRKSPILQPSVISTNINT